MVSESIPARKRRCCRGESGRAHSTQQCQADKSYRGRQRRPPEAHHDWSHHAAVIPGSWSYSGVDRWASSLYGRLCYSSAVDTPHASRRGSSGHAGGAPLRSRLRGLPGPTARFLVQRAGASSRRTESFFSPTGEQLERRDRALPLPHGRGLRADGKRSNVAVHHAIVRR
jgi:hypothetical protein